MKNEKGTIVLAGGVIGLIAAILVFFGNPANMGFCIACFLRDTTGALGLHSAAAVQYIRPEIIGLVLGACIISLAKKEFSPRGGSAPVTRFTLGAFVMIGCLMFLGCPFRMILRLAGGDGNALFGLVGFVAGILTGTVFLKKGYTLKRSYKMPKLEGSIYPAFQIVMLLLLAAAPAFTISQNRKVDPEQNMLQSLLHWQQELLLVSWLREHVCVWSAVSVMRYFSKNINYCSVLLQFL